MFYNPLQIIVLVICLFIKSNAFCQMIEPSNGSEKSTDISLLVGKWKSAASPNSCQQMNVEFKNASRAIVTSIFTPQGGGSHTEINDCNVRKKTDRIELEPREVKRRARDYHAWYEIPLPFDTSKLIFTQNFERNFEKSRTEYILQRESK